MCRSFCFLPRIDRLSYFRSRRTSDSQGLLSSLFGGMVAKTKEGTPGTGPVMVNLIERVSKAFALLDQPCNCCVAPGWLRLLLRPEVVKITLAPGEDEVKPLLVVIRCLQGNKMIMRTR